MEVEQDVAVNALCFAANMASGYNEWAWAGGLEIYTEMGMASQAGIVAFDLAKTGMMCSETLLEGRAGLFAALNASKGEALFRKGLETVIGSGIDAVRFKPVPGCNYAQTPLGVALRVAQKHDLSGGIRSVAVNSTSGAKNYPGCDNPGPFSEIQQTKMSIQFGVCAVLLHGNVSEELFTKFDDEDIAALAASCSVQPLAGYDRSFGEGRQPAAVEVHLNDGKMVREELPDVPWLDADAVRSRFLREISAVIELDDFKKVLMGELKSYSESLGLLKSFE